jgi:hypothetical protein
VDGVGLLERCERSRYDKISSKKYLVCYTSKNVILLGNSVRFYDYPHITRFEGLVSRTNDLSIRMTRGLSCYVRICKLGRL